MTRVELLPGFKFTGKMLKIKNNVIMVNIIIIWWSEMDRPKEIMLRGAYYMTIVVYEKLNLLTPLLIYKSIKFHNFFK
jgi:hypothetical protein